MKRLTILLAVILYCTYATAQTDTTIVEVKTDTSTARKGDTLRIGNIVIIKKGGKQAQKGKDSLVVLSKKKNSRVTTNWGIVDLGFANYSDKTNYVAARADGFLQDRPGFPALGKDDFKLRAGKSINVNIWFFMQQLNVVKRNVSLKYGLGLELNNYRFKSTVSFRENGLLPYSNNVQTTKPFIFRDSIAFSKNKLALDYLTVPLMLNFATNNWGDRRGFNIAFGVSGGYLYSQRNKQRSDARGKQKNKGDYDFEKFKLSYIGEIGFGPVKLYASYSPKSIYEHSMDVRPYNFGFRFSN